MSNDALLQHCWIHVSQRRIVLQDDEGYQEEIQWKFDSEGSEGFSETIENIRAAVPEEDLCFVL